MSRVVGPAEGARTVYTVAGGGLRSAAGLTATVYTDAAGTTPADILTQPGGTPVSGAQLTVDAYSRLPLFQYPDGVALVYASVAGGPVIPLDSQAPLAAAVGSAAGLAIVFGA